MNFASPTGLKETRLRPARAEALPPSNVPALRQFEDDTDTCIVRVSTKSQGITLSTWDGKQPQAACRRSTPTKYVTPAH